MRIAVLAPLRYPIAEPFRGGLEMHTYLLVRELKAAGHDVALFAHRDSDRTVNVVPVDLAADAGFVRQTIVYRDVMKRIVREKYDAVHNNSIHYLPPLRAGAVRCPMITVLHTPPYRSLRWAGRLSRAKNHTFVSISRHLHADWQPYVGEHPVVHNGIDPDDWPFANAPEAKTAVWYGRFTPEKGAEYAVEAARLAGFSLTLAGPVYDRAYFDEKIAPLLGPDVTYAGHLTRSKLAGLIGRSAVGLVTSVWDEPFGLVYVEIPACGTPVVAFDSGAAGEIVTGDTGVLVPKYDVAALAKAMGESIALDRAQCRRSVENAFGVAGMVTRYLKLYKV